MQNSKILIVIVSYNSRRYMQECIESLRIKLNPESYKIVVVDNASTDGIAEWLSAQADIMLIQNHNNVGFGPACNQAVAATKGTEYETCDVFLLNNDTIMTSKAIPIMTDYLRNHADVGAIGAMSNYAGNRQEYPVKYESVQEYINFGEGLDSPYEDAFVEKVRLNGFAMLIRRSIWDDIGGFDEDFAPGYYEDDAISMEILKRGYRLILSRNSFIYHVGSASFVKSGTNKLSFDHHELFIKKYNFDILNYVYPCGAVISQIPYKRDDHFRVLHLGCGLGAELKAIKSLFPGSEVYGIEKNPVLSAITKTTETVFNSVEEAKAATGDCFFDLLIVDSYFLDTTSNTDKQALAQMCSENATEINRLHEYDDFPFDDIALILWDKNIYSHMIADHLANWGVMSSIYESDNLRKRIESYHIPPQNMMLLSGDQMLRASAFMMFPGLKCELPTIVPYISAFFGRLPVSDPSHHKARELELFEKKYNLEKEYPSHDSFIADSMLEVSVRKDCLSKSEDILKLLDETYKFGKIQNAYDADRLNRLLTNDWNDCTYISAKDKYTDYGVIGFSCYNQRSSEQMCSAISWFMNEDDINKFAERNNCSWESKKASSGNSIRILLKGNENLHPIEDYLIGGNITTEYDSHFDPYYSPLPSMLYTSTFHIIIFSLLQEDYSAWEKDSERKLSELIETLDRLTSKVPGNPMIILLLGYESNSEISGITDGNLAQLHSEINPIVQDYTYGLRQIRTINVTEFIQSRSDFNDSVNVFSTRVYSDLVERICVYINEKVDSIMAGRP